MAVVGGDESIAGEEVAAAGDGTEGGAVANGSGFAVGGTLLFGADEFSERVESPFVADADSVDGGVAVGVAVLTSTHAVAPPMNFFS